MRPKKRIRRRRFLQSSAAFAIGSTLSQSPRLLAAQQENSESEISWTPASELDVEGRGFDDTARYFDRLPARAESVVRKDVWNLSRMPCGMVVRFQTDSPHIHVRYRLLNTRLAMPHMPATSVSGVDLYAESESGTMQWAAVLKPTQPNIDARLLGNIIPMKSGGTRRFNLYLPLFNSIADLQIGVAKTSVMQSAGKRTEKPVAIYGTSIMHGACATRSGMSISSILGRRLKRPMINLGFSGNGRMELEVGQFLRELDPAVFVIDCLPNLNAQLVAERTEPLVRLIRNKRPDTPVLLVEDRIFSNAWIRKGAIQRHTDNQRALRKAFQRLLATGDQQLFYLAGKDLLGDDHEAATDGSHPNDMGMARYADAYEPVLKAILNNN